MKPKKVELVLKKSRCRDIMWWELYTIDGEYLGRFCNVGIQKLFHPGDETCLVLEITAHPATWTGENQ